ncbi:hypothetical protein BLL69_1806c [Lacticaseibacillus paracasei]|nr:hypothetical protein BLL69_1806c [Lacticaseibacillus paracasei]
MNPNRNGLNARCAVAKGADAEMSDSFRNPTLGQLDNIRWTVANIAGR